MGHAKYQPVSWLCERNCDGCSKDNLGPCSGGGIIRDDKGRLVNAYNATTGITLIKWLK